MEAALLLRLQILINRLREAISTTTEACERSEAGITVDELHKIRSQLKTCTTNVCEEIRIYISKSSENNQDIVRECTELQVEAENQIASLDSVLQIAKNLDNTQQTKLPKLSLPKFNGDILKWYDFWDQFEASVDKKSLPEVEKLSYLLSCLQGPALDAVEGVGITNKNYKIAVDILKNRFGNKKILVDSHYEELHKLKVAGSSTTEYRRVLNSIEKVLRILHSLGEDINNNHLRVTILSKFPEKILYELNIALKENDSVNAIRNQLETIITAMELSQRVTSSCKDLTTSAERDVFTTDALFVKEGKRSFPNKQKQKGTYLPKDKKAQKRKATDNRQPETSFKRPKRSCVFCDGSHYNDTCPQFTTVSARKKKLMNKCHRCFKTGHFVKECPMKWLCYHCKGVHNRALCPKKFADTETSKTPSEFTVQGNHCHMSNHCSFLQTATATAKNLNKEKTCRLLLDSGSQRSYITSKLADDLNLKLNQEDRLMIYTFGTDKPKETSSPTTEINLITRRGITRKLQVNVVPHITDRILVPKVYKHKCVDLLADDGSAGEGVDLLIGNDYYFSFFNPESIKLQNNLFLINTQLGWVLSGRKDSKEVDQEILSVITYCQCHGPECMYYTEPDLPLRNMDLTFLWSLESIGIMDSPRTTREEEAIKHFNNTVQYESQRYMVKWPWIQYPPDIPTNFGLAYGRLKGLMQRMDQGTLEEYEQILKEQLQLGIIETVEPESDVTTQKVPPVHYLPHHIIKQEGKKGRIVYDASAKLKDHKNLNECMYKGPSLIGDLLAILIKFRTHKIAVTADVEKAFLQIGLQNDDREVTRFLWLKDITQPVSETNLLHLRFCRVPFGVIASPFILTATINYHISRNNPQLQDKVAEKCYVDNLVTGANSVKEAQQLYKDTKRVFQDLSMNIREWNSNNTEFLDTIPEEFRSKPSAETKMLGLIWNTAKDTIHLKIKDMLLDEETTQDVQCKREVLSTIASVYDPCGFCSPLILPAKLLLQQLWENKLKWDTVLPEDLQQKWEEAADSLRMVRGIEIPRLAGITSEEEAVKYELHCFTDASKDAYAAVVYLRSSNRTENSVAFLLSKSKVTPKEDKDDLKIPKLELLGYYIGSKLITYVRDVIGLPVTHQYLWTDSMIVLSWMKSNKLLPPFVSRRVNTIKRNKDLQACYINTNNNPADVATRPDLWLQKKDLWFHGPSFLQEEKENWPHSMYPGSQNSSYTTGEGPDQENPDATVLMNNEEEDDYDLSFLEESNIQPREDKDENLKKIQREYFPDEIEGKETHLTRNLGLYLDVDGILRCRGRMANTNWSYDAKHPALIPRNCEFTHKIVKDIHEKNYHVGVSHTLSLIRENYWIPQGRAQVQRVIRNCANCVKQGGGPYKLPATSDLPAERVNFSAPFTYSGIDYFGPVFINGELGSEKRWVCLITCLAVRAIHMEIVKNLTADECLLALRRFVAIRGVPEAIFSDNATLFKLTSEVLSTQIKWKFIPQLAPWHGGFYERIVGLVKHCMRRTLEKHLLRESQLHTVIKEIESVLNSRPLTCVSSEPEHILKPADFLTLGKCLVLEPIDGSLPSGSSVTKQTLVDGWKKDQKVIEEFRNMFVTQYLFSLREKYNYSPKQPRVTTLKSPSIGDVVQIRGDAKNRSNWKVGKIVSLTMGADGACRVAKVKVGNSEFTRSIGHLYPLELTEESQPEASYVMEPEIAPQVAVDLPQPSVEIEEQELTEGDPVTSNECSMEFSESTLDRDEGGLPLESEPTENPIDESKAIPDEVEASTPSESVPDDDLLPERVKRKAAIKAMERMAEQIRHLLAHL